MQNITIYYDLRRRKRLLCYIRTEVGHDILLNIQLVVKVARHFSGRILNSTLRLFLVELG